MTEFTDIPGFIRSALGDEVEISEELINGHFAIRNKNNVIVDVMKIFDNDAFVALQVKINERINGRKVTVICAHYFRPIFGPNPEGFADAYSRLLIRWEPHQAAIDARTAGLAAQAEAKAQEQRYIDAGPELVAALEEVQWGLYVVKIPHTLAVPVCPLCANDPFKGHKPHCIIGIAIARTK